MNLPTKKDNFSLARNNLLVHVNDKDIFNPVGRRYGNGVVVSGNLSRKILRQSYYVKSLFDNVDFNNVGMTGSTFIESIFQNCLFSGANFHSCNFDDVRFVGTDCCHHNMIDAGFHKSTIINSYFSNLHIESCGFTDVVFYNTIFENCTIRTCSLENARFVNCSFINVNLSTINLEYSEFENTTIKESILPFHSILSATGLVEQLSHAINTYVYSASNQNKKISINDYLDLISDFEQYYINTEKYFPLCNIYIYQKNNKKLRETILSALLSTIQCRDFRSLKYLCKMIGNNNIFTIQERRDFYDDIIRWIAIEKFTISEYHSYQLTCGDLREYLINNSNTRYILNFYIKTNIDSLEKEKLIVFLNVFDNILSFCNLSDASVELRHNSDISSNIQVFCENMYEVSKILTMIYYSLGGISLFAVGIGKVISFVQTLISENDAHKKAELEIEQLRINNSFLERMKQIEYEKELLSYKKLEAEYDILIKESKNFHKIILDNDIQCLVNHTSKNITNPPFEDFLQHYESFNFKLK
jgi:uncharacterized protein YjbI with pentapeptide repeats